MTLPCTEHMSLPAIRVRIEAARAKIAGALKYDKAANKVTLSLSFEDEGALAEDYVQALADCGELLKILDARSGVE